ncbi:MAG: ferrochelatase [Terriglobales bacterium]
MLIVSFGGPQGREDVLPFLEHVVQGRNVPPARLLEVAEHYYHFGGRSPIVDQTRSLADAVRAELQCHGPRLPVYQGNRNWHPFIEDTVRTMATDGVKRTLAFVTSAFGSYSSCRQYLEDIARARAAIGGTAPEIAKMRLFYNHPLFLELWTERLRAARLEAPKADVLFTAHSIPMAMAAASPYAGQLHEAAAAVAAAAGAERWSLAFQSRSGSPQQPWLEPAVEAELERLQASGAAGVILVPLGFLTAHMEVAYDLGVEARDLCRRLGLPMMLVPPIGDHPRFAGLVRELILERCDARHPRLSAGPGAAWPDDCPDGHCQF